ncbi:hypothetical protein [Bordetella avium]|uniref:hypothetical protein n=1 Tax=Bordetella avium TaxID=521 RepID=UPI000E0BFFB4|nr:hypothetical protein [Bordetella avium]RIQ14251.1 hypothetical protein D0432_08400 [Bordetella avium]RIQ39946.1 hypothetical protein D0848_06390 [Bordetella avium]RIQ44746.1 hypothetical protein D0847_06370 [Bordetella avium]RIQ45036.1 hypothetical protein D0846_03840 [Bordetella avium]RIQ47664.1 hypothetical protein D0845_13265 [Bordetella avium]
MTAVYIDKRFDVTTPLYCRLTPREFQDLFDSEQIRFHGRATVWPASQADGGARMACGVPVLIPPVWRERLQTPSHEAAWEDSHALIGMLRWFLSTPPEREPASVVLHSTVGAVAQAAQDSDGLRLVIAPVRYVMPPMQRPGSMRLPDLFSGKVQRRRECEARVVAMQNRKPQGPEGITRVRRVPAFALGTLVGGVAMSSLAPPEAWALVTELTQTRLGLPVSTLY